MPGHANRFDASSSFPDRASRRRHASPTATRGPRAITRWTVLLPLLVALLSHRAAAQGSTTPPAGAHPAPASAPPSAPLPLPTTAPSATHPFDGITLTEAQRTALKRMAAQTQAARAAILRRQAQGGQLSRADRDALIALGKAHNARVDSLLAPAQRARLASNVAAERARRDEERRAASARRSSTRRR